MIILASTSDKIQVITSAIADIEVHASWMDNLSGAMTPGRTNTASISTATTTDVVASPAASTQRNVKTISIRNNHASTACAVTVQHTDGTNVEALIKPTLLAGEAIVWIDQVGWIYYAADGTVKPGQGTVTVAKLASDQSNSTTTPTKVTGISVALAAGTYTFDYYVLCQSSIITTGVKYSVDFTGTVTSFVANMMWVDVSATASTATPSQAAVGAAGQVYSAMSARAKSQAGWGTLLGTDAANADMLVRIEGMMIVTAAGNIDLWHGSETAAATTTKAGSAVIITKVG